MSTETRPADGGRADDKGRAFKGSQLQTQLYVNVRTDKLNDAVRAEFPEVRDARIDWRSPLATERYREYYDKPFLEALGLARHGDELAEFWPMRGPVWDALAVVDLGGESGVILAEGKSYPGELLGSGCQASETSRQKIERALAHTQKQLGLAENAAAWCGPTYQSANRLAHRAWLEERGVRAWLVHLLFTDDPHGPTTAEAWETAISKVDEDLGLTGPVPGVGHVLLPAGSYPELVAATTA